MPRSARIVYAGVPHHVTQRGNNSQEIFLDDDDRESYLRLLLRHSEAERVSVQGYCLMSNHVHLVVTPKLAESLACLMHVVNLKYAQHANDKYCRTGHLFGSRYYSCAMDDEHLWAAMRYVEQNPVRAGMVQRAKDWAWSSGPAHCGLRADPLIDVSLMKGWPPKDWETWLAEWEEGADDALRSATRKGWPIGGEAFLEKVRRALGVTFSPRAKGRPKAGT